MFKNLHNMSANYLKIELRRLHMLMQLKITFDGGIPDLIATVDLIHVVPPEVS